MGIKWIDIRISNNDNAFLPILFAMANMISRIIEKDYVCRHFDMTL